MKIILSLFLTLNFLSAQDLKQQESVLDTLEQVDSLQYDKKIVDELLENARIHWLNANNAFLEEDTSFAASEFEVALNFLMEISAFSDVENDRDFQDLSKSVLADYQFFISRANNIPENSSVSALREKLNIDIETNGVANITIPLELLNSTQIPMQMNEYVERIFSFFRNKGRKHFERWINLSGKYFPMMTTIFNEVGVPQELKYLAMCESGLNPNARSWAKAVGMWQFMKSTGKMYGLRSNYWYDERRDFEKATRAAALHLKDLHTEYNDWYLAIAAYNSGSGNINRGIRKSGSRDFWEMRKYLPRETRNYVPQYIGVTLMGLKPDLFGFNPNDLAPEIQYEYVSIDDCVDLSVLAKCSEITLEEIKNLNPELLRWCTPPNYKNYQLRIPKGKTEVFFANYNIVPENQKQNWIVHIVKKGETVSQIARKYNIISSVIREANDLSSKTKLKVGRELVIPVSISATFAETIEKEISEVSVKKVKSKKKLVKTESIAPKGKAKIIYLVKKGDSIGELAESFNVGSSQIRNWNNISYTSKIFTGQKLTIYVTKEKSSEYKLISQMEPSERKTKKSETKSTRSKKQIPSTHKIKDGESLETIAAKYGTTVSEIKKANDLKSSRIYAGDEIDIPKKNSSVTKTEKNRVESKSNSNSNDKSKHIVKKGESLDSISKFYGVSVEDLKDWNKLKSSKILVGSKLIIKKS